ncbi:MAG: c-type cytochrome [Rhodoferax sp.]
MKTIAGLVLWAASLAASAAAFEDSMAQRTLACTGCHGPQGKSGPDGYYPRLAGKPAGYLYNQLRNIQDGRRHYALMEGLLAPLSDTYLHEIADYFSSLDIAYPPPGAAVADPTTIARGQTLARQGDAALQLPACTQCNGSALMGVLPSTPALLGLPRDYLNAQLGGWQTGQRKAQAPDCMADIARRLSDADVHAVTSWLASQTVPQPSKAAAARPALAAGSKAIVCGSAP